MEISASCEHLDALAAAFGRGNGGLAGSVDAARRYQVTWCDMTGTRQGRLFSKYMNVADDVFDGARGALNHLEEALEGVQDQLKGTGQSFRGFEENTVLDVKDMCVFDD